MNGYYRNDAATELATGADGFFSAGDVVVQDEDDFLYIVDRVKDLIISGGANVYPREVEEVLIAHPDVDDVAVIGLADDEWGERVTAVVVGGATVVVFGTAVDGTAVVGTSVEGVAVDGVAVVG